MNLRSQWMTGQFSNFLYKINGMMQIQILLWVTLALVCFGIALLCIDDTSYLIQSLSWKEKIILPQIISNLKFLEYFVMDENPKIPDPRSALSARHLQKIETTLIENLKIVDLRFLHAIWFREIKSKQTYIPTYQNTPNTADTNAKHQIIVAICCLDENMCVRTRHPHKLMKYDMFVTTSNTQIHLENYENALVVYFTFNGSRYNVKCEDEK
jgi:hypothetical protein